MRQSAAMLMVMAGTALGCAPRVAVNAEPAPVTILVQNPTRTVLPTQVRGPDGCSGFREIRPGATVRFRINPGRIWRAVVTARRGTRVANFPVDILPGEAVPVALSLP